MYINPSMGTVSWQSITLDILPSIEMKMAPKVFEVGGTGAQGIPVIRGLVKDGAYSVLAMPRDINSARAKQLLPLGEVELLEGTFANENTLRAGLSRCQYAFIDIDGFNSGEKTEIFWAIRAYELALESGIKFFVYEIWTMATKSPPTPPSSAAATTTEKGRIGEWILSQTHQNHTRMGAALFTTGPYIEMSLGKTTPMSPTIEDGGIVTWRVPLGSGAVPHVALEDCEYYVRWLFDHQQEANGLDLEVAIEHVDYHSLAAAFTKVTGHPARYIDTSLEEYWTSGPMAWGGAPSLPAGYNADPKDPATLTLRENFTGFWNLWKHSGGNEDVVKRDYALLDRIHPGRIRSVEEWFRREDKRGMEAGLG